MVSTAAKTIGAVLCSASIEYELIFIDDGSRDATWARISDCTASDAHVAGIRFSRNFGKEAALLAGLSYAKGDCCVTLDCDLQHPPEKIVEMYELWEQGFEVIEGVKSSRGKEGAAHALFAGLFYQLMGKAAGFDMSSTSDFKLLDRKAVDAILSMPEKDTFYRALSGWVGFRSVSISFDVAARSVGESKWSPIKLVQYAIQQITSFTTAPMQIVTVFGVIMLLLSIALGIQTLVHKLTGTAEAGFTTVIMVMLFTGSIIMISLGIMGYYMTKMFDEIKNRPRFIVAEYRGQQTRETEPVESR